MKSIAILAAALAALTFGSKNQQDLSAADHYRKALDFQKANDWSSAYKEAEKAYQLGLRESAFLECLVELMNCVGMPREAEPIIRDLATREPTALHYALYARTTGNYGDIAKANTALTPLLRNESEWVNQRNAVLGMIDNVCTRTYVFTVSVDPELEKWQQPIKPDIRVPVPIQDLKYQSATWQVIGAAASKEEVLPDGNKCLRVTPKDGKPFKVLMNVTLRLVNSEALAKEGDADPMPAEVSRYLKPSPNNDIDDPSIQAVVAKLKDPKSRTNTVKNILKFHTSIIAFVPPGKDGSGKASEVLARRYGHCEGSHTLTVTLLRAAGIPARYVRGHGAIKGDKGRGSHHTIAQFYLPRAGWVVWDDQTGPFIQQPNYLSLFTYNEPFAGPPVPGGDFRPFDLWNFQGMGGNCEYQEFICTKRSAPGSQ